MIFYLTVEIFCALPALCWVVVRGALPRAGAEPSWVSGRAGQEGLSVQCTSLLKVFWYG